MAININGENLSPERLIALWLHGRYLHKANEKSAVIDAFPVPAILKSDFMSAMHRLSHVFLDRPERGLSNPFRAVAAASQWPHSGGAWLERPSNQPEDGATA